MSVHVWGAGRLSQTSPGQQILVVGRGKSAGLGLGEPRHLPEPHQQNEGKDKDACPACLSVLLRGSGEMMGGKLFRVPGAPTQYEGEARHIDASGSQGVSG